MKYRWQLLLLLASIHFSNIVDSMIIMPMGDIFISSFDINSSQYSLLVSSYAFAAFISAILGMFLVDRFERKKALIFSYGGFMVGTLLCALSGSYHLLLLCRFVTGLFGGVLGALVMAIVTDLYPFKERGQAIGILMGSFSVASALGVPIGLYLASVWNWQAPFICIGIFAAIILLITILIFPKLETEAEAQKPLETVKSIAKDPNQLIALLTLLILVTSHFLIIPFITPYMVRNVGFSQEQIALIFLLGGIATVFSSPFIGKLTDIHGVMKVFIMLMFISIIPTIAISHMGSQEVWFALIFTTLFFVFGSGRMIPANTLITAAVGPKTRGSFMSLRSAVSQLAIAISSFISGFIVFFNDHGQLQNYGYVAYLAIILGIITLYLCSKIKVAKGN